MNFNIWIKIIDKCEYATNFDSDIRYLWSNFIPNRPNYAFLDWQLPEGSSSILREDTTVLANWKECETRHINFSTKVLDDNDDNLSAAEIEPACDFDVIYNSNFSIFFENKSYAFYSDGFGETRYASAIVEEGYCIDKVDIIMKSTGEPIPDGCYNVIDDLYFILHVKKCDIVTAYFDLNGGTIDKAPDGWKKSLIPGIYTKSLYAGSTNNIGLIEQWVNYKPTPPQNKKFFCWSPMQGSDMSRLYQLVTKDIVFFARYIGEDDTSVKIICDNNIEFEYNLIDSLNDASIDYDTNISEMTDNYIPQYDLIFDDTSWPCEYFTDGDNLIYTYKNEIGANAKATVAPLAELDHNIIKWYCNSVIVDSDTKNPIEEGCSYQFNYTAQPCYILSGLVYDEATGDSIENATVEYISDDYSEQVIANTDKDGKYQLKIPVDKNKGKLIVSCDSYSSKSVSIELDDDKEVSIGLEEQIDVVGYAKKINGDSLKNVSAILKDADDKIISSCQTLDNGFYFMKNISTESKSLDGCYVEIEDKEAYGSFYSEPVYDYEQLESGEYKFEDAYVERYFPKGGEHWAIGVTDEESLGHLGFFIDGYFGDKTYNHELVESDRLTSLDFYELTSIGEKWPGVLHLVYDYPNASVKYDLTISPNEAEFYGTYGWHVNNQSIPDYVDPWEKAFDFDKLDNPNLWINVEYKKLSKVSLNGSSVEGHDHFHLVYEVKEPEHLRTKEISNQVDYADELFAGSVAKLHDDGKIYWEFTDYDKDNIASDNKEISYQDCGNWKAIPKEGYEFSYWTIDGQKMESDKEYVFSFPNTFNIVPVYKKIEPEPIPPSPSPDKPSGSDINNISKSAQTGDSLNNIYPILGICVLAGIGLVLSRKKKRFDI